MHSSCHPSLSTIVWKMVCENPFGTVHSQFMVRHEQHIQIWPEGNLTVLKHVIRTRCLSIGDIYSVLNYAPTPSFLPTATTFCHFLFLPTASRFCRQQHDFADKNGEWGEVPQNLITPPPSDAFVRNCVLGTEVQITICLFLLNFVC